MYQLNAFYIDRITRILRRRPRPRTAVGAFAPLADPTRRRRAPDESHDPRDRSALPHLEVASPYRGAVPVARTRPRRRWVSRDRRARHTVFPAESHPSRCGMAPPSKATRPHRTRDCEAQELARPARSQETG